MKCNKATSSIPNTKAELIKGRKSALRTYKAGDSQKFSHGHAMRNTNMKLKVQRATPAPNKSLQ
jgi:hypothetical protein